MDQRLQPLFTPWKIGNCEIKNRIVLTSMGGTDLFGWMEKNHFDKDGARFIMEVAKNNAGLVLPGCQPVYNPMFGQWLHKNKKMYADLKKWTPELHKTGAKLFVQLTAGFGRSFTISEMMEKLYTNPALRVLSKPFMDLDKITASASPSPNRWSDKVPSREMTKAEIKEFVNAFAESAKMLKDAGVDGVEVHAVHEGYLLDQFTLKYVNKRTDEYGGSAENRARFAAEAVSAVHAAVPGMPIDYKLAVRQENPHFGNAGVVEEELPVFVPLLEQAGVTSFHVTLANHSALENTIPPADHPYFSQPGCFLKFCDEVRQYTELPICGVGGLNDPDLVEQQLASGRIQCAAMSRQLLADPDWVNKLKNGQAKQIHRCLRCNKKCLGGLTAHQGTHCVYDALREKEAKNA